MNYLMKYVVFSLFLLSFVSCEKNNEQLLDIETVESSIDLREGDNEDNIAYYYLGGNGGAAECDMSECSSAGACFVGFDPIMYRPEEELIIEAAATKMNLAKITKLNEKLLRVDLVYSYEGYESTLEINSDQKDKFFVRESGLFAGAMEALKMGATNGIQNGPYTIQKQEDGKIWSGHFLVDKSKFN